MSSLRTWVLRALALCAAVVGAMPATCWSADQSDAVGCSVCDLAVYVKLAIAPCFLQKTDRYIAEAQSGPILVDYGTCEEPPADTVFHAPKPRLLMPVVENKCATGECTNAEGDDYIFLLSQAQLRCLKDQFPKAFDAQGPRVKIDLAHCK